MIQKINENNYLNYQNQLKEVVKLSEKPTLLLHICCAPCSSGCIEKLVNYFNVKAFFYNPNISLVDEYEKRKNELKRFIKENDNLNNVEIIDCDYENDRYLESIKGLEKEKEGGKRCEKCFNLRLEKTAKVCKEKGYDYFATTLTISPLKDEKLLNSIGYSLSIKYDVNYLFSNFKKDNGYKLSLENSKKYHLYRQDYCGCIYSKLERELVKKLKENNN